MPYYVTEILANKFNLISSFLVDDDDIKNEFGCTS